ncbi:MAG: Clp protease ClpP [Leucobacter sp.]|nr:Clp protease ClpP [Leucobacter sp.]
MGELSALGPIDAQIISNGKRFSADAFLEGLTKIKTDAENKKRLDIAYIPILQNISPGEIQHCENAQSFSRTLVTNWLKEYKFKYWAIHSSTGNPVTDDDKRQRAEEIATILCNHSSWLTHGRSIGIRELEDIRLQITDYSNSPELNDAISRYYTLLRMSFETNLYKVYETPSTQIYRMLNSGNQQSPSNKLNIPNPAIVDFECGKCHNKQKIQINFNQKFPLLPGVTMFPQNNILKCEACGSDSNLLSLRQQLEAQTKKRII